MIRSFLLTISLTLPLFVNATVVVMNNNGEIAGIDGLLYKGESWDVRFSNQGLWAPDYNYWGEAQQFELHSVLQQYIQSEQYSWRGHVPWISGCYSRTRCEIFTAREGDQIQGSGLVYAHQIHLTGTTSGYWLTSSLEKMYNQSGIVTWTNFRPSPVPEPSTAWLFVTALIGLAGLKRKNNDTR